MYCIYVLSVSQSFYSVFKHVHVLSRVTATSDFIDTNNNERNITEMNTRYTLCSRFVHAFQWRQVYLRSYFLCFRDTCLYSATMDRTLVRQFRAILNVRISITVPQNRSSNVVFLLFLFMFVVDIAVSHNSVCVQQHIRKSWLDFIIFSCWYLTNIVFGISRTFDTGNQEFEQLASVINFLVFFLGIMRQEVDHFCCKGCLLKDYLWRKLEVGSVKACLHRLCNLFATGSRLEKN